jgi:hypothetical protein
VATYTDLRDLLAPIGLPVQMPGAPDVALPAITLEPTGISMLPGIRVGWETANVAIRYPLSHNNANQFDNLNADTYHVLRILIGSEFLVESDVPLFGDSDLNPPSFRYQVSVTFPGAHDVC